MTLIDDYLTSLAAAGHSAATQRLRRDQLEHVARELGPLDTITEPQFLDWFGTQAWRRETRRSYRNGIHGFTQWAHRNGRIPVDWAVGVPVISPDIPAPRPTPDTAWTRALLAADERTSLMLRLAGLAGLRRGEIACIRSEDVADGHLTVHGKGGKLRVIPLNPDLAQKISAAPGWVFPNGRGGHLTPHRVGELCAQVLPGGVHALRHRFATRAYHGSHDIRAVQLLLGHASVATTQRYVQVCDDELRAAMQAAA